MTAGRLTLRRPGVLGEMPEDLAARARAGDLVGAQRRRLLEAVALDVALVLELLNLIAANRLAAHARVEVVGLCGVVAEQRVPDRLGRVGRGLRRLVRPSLHAVRDAVALL